MKIVLLPGDGIGPEIMDATVSVMDAAAKKFGFALEYDKQLLGGCAIDQVVIGSCTNGRLEDLAQAAEVLKGHKVCDHVRCIIIPATQEIYEEAIRLGYIDTFIQADAAVSTPTCGPCLGGYMGILAAGERCVSTTNRNFRGRMGHVDSEVYLASPYTAAASAVKGYIASAEEVLGK